MRYQIPIHARSTIKASRQRGTDLARAVGLPPHRFSGYLNGTTFGERTAERIRAVGPLVGLSPESCVELFRDPLFAGREVAS